jgi:hypothetical protein
LQEEMDTPSKRLASLLAIAGLRGDNRIECGMVADEHRPVTIEEVISPVPIDPSFISGKAKGVEIRGVPRQWWILGESSPVVAHPPRIIGKKGAAGLARKES